MFPQVKDLAKAQAPSPKVNFEKKPNSIKFLYKYCAIKCLVKLRIDQVR